MGSSMGNPMGLATMYSGSQHMYAPKVTGGYVGKSKLKDSSAASVRSKSMRSGMSRRSNMSKRKPTKRFNEEIDTMSKRSKQPHQRAPVKNYNPQGEKPSVEDKKKQVMEKVNKMDSNLEKLRSTFNIDNEKPNYDSQSRHGDFERTDEANGQNGDRQDFENDEENKQKDEQDIHDEIDSLYYGYSESMRSGQSRRSQMTSATYISKLEKELQEERRAREKLAKELEEIKKISSEISSHLGLKNTMNNN